MSVIVEIVNESPLVQVSGQSVQVFLANSGPQGPSGQGIIAGGTTHQVLAKASNANYDMEWINAGISPETIIPVTSGSSYTLSAVTPGQTINIIVNKTIGSPTTVNIPGPQSGARVYVTDGKGDAGINPITVNPSSGGTSNPGFLINIDWQSLSYLGDGEQWNVQ